MSAAAILLGIAVVVAAYCVVWLGFVKRTTKFELHSPWAPPVMTVAGIAAWIWFDNINDTHFVLILVADPASPSPSGRCGAG